MKLFGLAFLICLFSSLANAKEIADINFNESVKIEGADQLLKLNGLAIRHKLFFKIYIAALYVEQVSQDADALIQHTGAKRMTMHFIYDEVPREKLINGWLEGFEDNVSDDALALLKPRIDQFNAMFETLHKDDEVFMDYLPGQGTRVTIKGKNKGFIKGQDFYQALLKIWLGEDPVTDDVKSGLLGLDE